MANVFDYLKWRGDLSFSADPFNEIDNLLLSYVSYVDLDGAAPGPGEEGVPLHEVSRRFFQTHSKEDLEKDKSFFRMAPYIMRDMAGTERFQDCRLGNYVNLIDEVKNLQMSAVTADLSDGSCYVAYRGTDDRIMGWKEDFLISTRTVAAQREAVNYINALPLKPGGVLRTGGHSKGGHLAIYASAMARPEVKERIVTVYNNDGPGFRDEFLKDPTLQSLLPRIVRIIPEGSVIGLLLGHVAEPVIIKSTGFGVFQHDALTWEVMGNRFVREEKLAASSLVFQDSMTEWLSGIDNEGRISFINDVFDVLEAPGAETLTELQNGGLKSVFLMMKKRDTLPEDTRDKIDRLLKILLSRWGDYLTMPLRDITARLTGKDAE